MNQNNSTCNFIHFALIVTGIGEERHLPKLFQVLTKTGLCHFQVLCRVGQRGPITSQKQQLKMVGSNKKITNRDEEEIGLPSRRYISDDSCRFVLLIDDLESDRRNIARDVFNRYKNIFTTLMDESQQRRASVHFLVNMLEAYYFAHVETVNSVLNADIFDRDYEGDVEDIEHPKSTLKIKYRNFDEVEHGGTILDFLDIEHVLSRPDTCASLRTLFAWCVKAISKIPHSSYFQMQEKFCLQNGVLSDITRNQLDKM